VQPIHFAVVGCGRIGHRHASLLQKMQAAKLVALVETDVEKKELLETEFKIPVFTSIDQLSQLEKIDVLNICTPNGLHTVHCINGLRQNYHIICEKPFGLATENCQAVIELSEQKNKQVFCVMQNRYSPPSVWLKETIPLLGNIYQVYINCFWNRSSNYYEDSNWKGTLELDGGPLYTQFSHFVDALLWLFGDVTLTQATFAKHTLLGVTPFEDTGNFSFKMNRGGEGHFHYTTATYQQNLESSITIIAEKGSIKVGGQYMDKVLYCNIEDYTFKPLSKSNPPNEYGQYKGSAANHQYVFDNVIKYLKGENAHFTTAKEGLQVVKIIETVYQNR